MTQSRHAKMMARFADNKKALEAVLKQQAEPVAWECKAGGLKPLSQRQYETQPANIQRHYTQIAPQCKPLSDDAVGFECRKHFWMHGTRFEDAYKLGFRDAEAAHGIKEGT